MDRVFAVQISEGVLRSMVLATLEAYCYGDNWKKGRVKLETLGYIWGNWNNQTDDVRYAHVDVVSTSLSAVRRGDSVLDNVDAAPLKNAEMGVLAPHLHLIGDFHSHPYESIQEVKEISGFNFSEQDYDWFLSDDYLWEHAREQPIMMAMTICRVKKVHGSNPRKLKPSLYEFNVGDYRLWLNVVVGYRDHKKKRRVTGIDQSEAYLFWPGEYFSVPGVTLERPK